MDSKIIYMILTAGMLILLGILVSSAAMKIQKNTMIPELSIVWGGGIMLISICSAAFIGFLAVRETKIKNNIESALSKNYTGYTNYYGENTFVYDGEKYSFEYDLDTNTLTVFTENGTVVDGVYVDGIYVQGRHKNDVNKDVSETELESKSVDTSVNASIKTTLESYYSGSTDYKDQTFVYDGKKYNYDYNTETKTLTVFDGTGTIVNSIQIDGVYKLSQDQCKDPNTNGKEVSSETTSESAATDTSKKSMNSDSTAVSENQEGLAKRIQDKIQERYTNAVITSFDTTNLTGTFESDTGNYGFHGLITC